MKSYKTKAAALLCVFSLLCSCTQETEATTEPNSINAENPDKSTLSEIYTAYALDEKGGTVEGDTVPVENRVKFEYTPADIENIYSESLYEFLSELDMPEITDLTKRAYRLMLLLGTENFGYFTNIQQTDAILSFSEYDLWYGTGIDYESFCDAYLEVFTVSAAERLFSAYSLFGSYQGELWLVGTSLGGNAYLVREEYELISKTENEIVFQRTDFMEDFTQPLYDEPVYDPERRNEYIKKIYNYIFLKTDQGWRADEFSVNSLTTGGVDENTVSDAEETADQPEEDKPIFASEEDKAAFELLGDYTAEHSTYPNRHVELHISGEDWELSEDYELFRKYFFGSWGSQFHGLPYVIDDSKNAFIAKSSSFFMEFYKVGEDVLVFETGSAAGGTLYWLDINDPDTLYGADGAPGGSPNGIFSGEGGFPGVWALHKNDTAPNEPENNYLSVYRLREMAQKHGIDYGLIVDVELEALPWARHDSRYYFYPMYLVSEEDNRIEILTQAGDPYSYAVDIRIILQKIDGEWVRTVEESAEEFFPLKNPEYELIGAYLNDENRVCVDFSSMPVPENYDLFRKYFFGVWDSPDKYLPWSLTLDDSENINFAGRGYYGEFYQPKDYVIAFIVHTNADAHVFWLDMYYPDVIYTASCYMTNELAFFTVQGITSDVHTLIQNDAAPSKPSDGFLSIFKLHEMARDYGIDFDLLTYIDCGMIDGIYYLHSATYDFYPMYLVSESDDKIVIRTTVGNLMYTDLKPIEVICTFEKTDGEWVRTVEFDDGAELQ